uniref:Peptidase C1A papain C-terminal domain-containing protein n=1 Tax=Globodera rostochiensis TaxID=31243 RepID=A0A914HK33_GLORO
MTTSDIKSKQYLLSMAIMAIYVGCTASLPQVVNLAIAKKLVSDLNLRTNGLWTPVLNRRFASMNINEKRRMTGLRGVKPPPPVPVHANLGTTRRHRLGATCTNRVAFDVRTQWPSCADIVNKVHDQTTCASCWAVSTASAFTDRYCIERAKRGQSTSASTPNNHFSSLDVLSCSPNSYGCNGGFPDQAWRWIKYNGVTSGTDYTTSSGCKPYPFPPHSNKNYNTPACASSCTNSRWSSNYSADKKYATWVGSLYGNGIVASIQNELRHNGTVVAAMDIYDDFFYYSTGVYRRVSNNYIGGHAIRLIGWGTRTCTDGTSQDYWLAVNSWNTNWGQQGVFQIARGTNDCRIETMGIYFGTPRV